MRATRTAEALLDGKIEPFCKDQELYGATPGCLGRVFPDALGGYRCNTCSGWIEIY